MSLKLIDRIEYDPFAPYYVMCSLLIIMGLELKFGDPVPEYANIHHKLHHWHNGVLGLESELALCGGVPLRLCHEDPLMPIARYIDAVSIAEDEANPIPDTPIVTNERDPLSMENAGLLKSKDDLIAYASQYGIKLKKASNISIVKMLETMAEQAVVLGFIKA